jgi:LemA protein
VAASEEVSAEAEEAAAAEGERGEGFSKGGLDMKGILIGLLIVVAVIGVALASTYNVIVTKHENISAKWAQVESQLQRRNDLIPNLVNSVKGYAAHEKTVFENVTKARSQWAAASTIDEKVKAAAGLDSAISRLLLVAENYPELKANETFLKLMDELSGTENRIAVERMRYNESVRDYNVTVRRFPGNIVAGTFGYKPASEYFKAEDKARLVPEVKF